MYVKISPHNVGEEVLFQVEGNAHYGIKISDVPPAKRLYEDELGVTFHLLHINGLVDEATGQTRESKEDYWVYNYAWWWGDGLEGVVTNHRIFLLSDSGKTIDSVR